MIYKTLLDIPDFENKVKFCDAYYLNNLKKLTSFQYHLLNMFSNIKFYDPSVAEDNLFKLKDGTICPHSDREYHLVQSWFIHNKTIYCPTTIPHELSHLVEMKDSNRWTQQDWGLKFHFDNIELSTKTYLAMTSREHRVVSIQDSMQNLPLNNNFNYFWKNPYNVFKNAFEYNGQFKLKDPDFKYQDKLSYDQWIKSRPNVTFGRFKTLKNFEEWLDHIAETTYKSYSKDKIEHELKIRAEYINNFLEK